MWSDQELVEVLRNSVPYYLVVALPLLIMLSPVPVDAAAEFTVYRLQQYDLHGVAHGKYCHTTEPYLLFDSIPFARETSTGALKRGHWVLGSGGHVTSFR